MTRGLLILCVSAAVACASGSMAYVLSDSRWRTGTTTIHVGIPGTAQSGIRFRDAVVDAIAQWNTTPFRFVIDDRYRDPCSGYTRSPGGNGFPAGEGDSFNGMDFRADVCGNEFGSEVLAITLSIGQNNNLGFQFTEEADIIFNSAYDWNVYEGPRRARVDLHRVVLHELGHVLGLGHEPTAEAIMAPKIGDFSTLTADDKAGARALYGEPETCPIRALAVNTQRRDSLTSGDCTMQRLYGSGTDLSFVDVYRLDLASTTTLRIGMESAFLDSVVLITDTQLRPIGNFFDDSNGSCHVDERLTLPAGQYLLLANTYNKPEKCGSNTGNYTLTLSDSPYPLLGKSGNARSGGQPSSAIFSGWARLDTGTAASATFAPTDRITVEGLIDPDPAHLGQSARLFVVAVLSDGRQLMRLANGQFVTYTGLGKIQPTATTVLSGRLALGIIEGLRGSSAGLAGLGIQVFIGYALDSAPADIHFGTQPISFRISG